MVFIQEGTYIYCYKTLLSAHSSVAFKLPTHSKCLVVSDRQEWGLMSYSVWNVKVFLSALRNLYWCNRIPMYPAKEYQFNVRCEQEWLSEQDLMLHSTCNTVDHFVDKLWPKNWAVHSAQQQVTIWLNFYKIWNNLALCSSWHGSTILHTTNE